MVASSTSITYTDQASFLGALSSSITEDFEGYAAGTVITNQLTGVNSVTTDGTGGSTQAEIGSVAGLPFPMTAGKPTSSGDRFLSSELAAEVYAHAGLIFDLDGAYNGVGLYVVDGGPLGNFNISLFDGLSLVDAASFPPQTLPNSFVGVISTVPFNHMVIDAADSGDSWGMDDFTIGKIVVPEPGTGILLGLGLAFVFGLRRRRAKLRLET